MRRDGRHIEGYRLKVTVYLEQVILTIAIARTPRARAPRGRMQLLSTEEHREAFASSKKPEIVQKQRLPVRYHVEDFDVKDRPKRFLQAFAAILKHIELKNAWLGREYAGSKRGISSAAAAFRNPGQRDCAGH